MTYPIEYFWALSRAVGFEPPAVKLQPEQPLIHDKRLAYFLLAMPGDRVQSERNCVHG